MRCVKQRLLSCLYLLKIKSRRIHCYFQLVQCHGCLAYFPYWALTTRYLSWDYKLPFSLTPRIRPSEYSITFRDSWVWSKDFEGSPPQLYRVNSWNSKKYIIYLAIVSGGKRQSIIIIFVSLIFRQYNNLGKGIQFNIFWSVLNRYFRLLFLKQGVPRVLKNYNIADPWNFLNSETIKRAAHKMQWWILSNNTQMWPQHISGLEK